MANKSNSAGSFLSQVTDENGTGLLTYVQLLMAKVETALPEATITLIVANPIKGTNSGEVEIISNIQPGALPNAIATLGKDLLAGVGKQIKQSEVN